MLNSLLSKKNKEEKCVIKKSRDRRLVVYTPIRGCLTKYRSYFLSQLSQPSINIRHVRNEFTLISPRGLGLLLKIGHFQVPAGLCIKTRVSTQPLIWKWFFILMQIKANFTKRVVHLASFWKWGFFTLRSRLLANSWPARLQYWSQKQFQDTFQSQFPSHL